MRQNLSLIYIDSGGGHRAAANALGEAIPRQEIIPPTCLVNIVELLTSELFPGWKPNLSEVFA